jgi:cellulose synthase/poly-beta-1,6-N-acetylglucosamine synthase-like glycosyltransferase
MLILETVILIYFGLVTSYSLICFFGSLFYKDKSFGIKVEPQNSFHILVPAYKEDAIILSTVKENLNLNYPKDKYAVTIIADGLLPKTIKLLQEFPVQLLRAEFDVSTKVKSLNLALQNESSEFKYILILDADNIMEPNFLHKLNELHNHGYQAIQTQRIPKNQNTTMAYLDGLSEAINYNLISKPGVTLKLSPGLKGSGMSFNASILKELLSTMTSVGGFDRELELKLLKRGVTIYYSHQTVLQDEKVSSLEVFKKQRTRWISSQFIYLRKYFISGIESLLKSGNLAYFNSSVLRNIQLPRFINIGLLFLINIVTYLFSNHLNLGWYIWSTLLIVNLVVIFCSIPKVFFSRKMVTAFFYIPSVFTNMLLVLLRLRGANKKFIHTPKTSDSSAT